VQGARGRFWPTPGVAPGMHSTRGPCVVPLSEALSGDHPLNDFRFVIDDEMRVALNHRERFVSEHVGDFKERGTLGGQH